MATPLRPLAERALPRVLGELERIGLLLVSDAALASIAGLVAGAPVRGSWWSHPLAHEIYDVCQYLDHETAAARVKLVAGKVTFVHAALRPCVAAVGAARAPWQMRGLSPGARRLLARTDEASALRLDELPGSGDATRRKARARDASELEKRLLVASDELHTERGAHVRQLQTWAHWLRELEPRPARVGLETARARLEAAAAALGGGAGGGQGLLPWPTPGA
jgi:hypothetical protein